KKVYQSADRIIERANNTRRTIDAAAGHRQPPAPLHSSTVQAPHAPVTQYASIPFASPLIKHILAEGLAFGNEVRERQTPELRQKNDGQLTGSGAQTILAANLLSRRKMCHKT